MCTPLCHLLIAPQSVKSFIRKRGYRQRALTTLGLFLADDFQIDVSLFALLLPAPGPRKVTLHTGSGRMVRSVTATVNTATGALWCWWCWWWVVVSVVVQVCSLSLLRTSLHTQTHTPFHTHTHTRSHHCRR